MPIFEKDITGSSLVFYPSFKGSEIPGSSYDITASATPIIVRVTDSNRSLSPIEIKRITVEPIWPNNYVADSSHYFRSVFYSLYTRKRTSSTVNFVLDSSIESSKLNVWNNNLGKKDETSSEYVKPFVLDSNEGLYIKLWSASGLGNYSLATTSGWTTFSGSPILKVKVYYDDYHAVSSNFYKKVSLDTAFTRLKTGLLPVGETDQFVTLIDLSTSAIINDTYLSSVTANSPLYIKDLQLQLADPWITTDTKFTYDIITTTNGIRNPPSSIIIPNVRVYPTTSSIEVPYYFRHSELARNPIELKLNQKLKIKIQYTGFASSSTTASPILNQCWPFISLFGSVEEKKEGVPFFDARPEKMLSLEVQDEGSITNTNTKIMNFSGAGVTVTPSQNNGVVVYIPGVGAAVSDDAYSDSWDDVTDVAPSKNAIYDKIETLYGKIISANMIF